MLSDQVKVGEIGGGCSTYETEEKIVQSLVGKPEVKKKPKD